MGDMYLSVHIHVYTHTFVPFSQSAFILPLLVAAEGEVDKLKLFLTVFEADAYERHFKNSDFSDSQPAFFLFFTPLYVCIFIFKFGDTTSFCA